MHPLFCTLAWRARKRCQDADQSDSAAFQENPDSRQRYFVRVAGTYLEKLMTAINLTEVKLHLRVDHDEEDDAITAMLDAAELHAANYLNTAEGLLESLEDSNGDIPAPVRSAVLLMVGSLYANREAQSERQLFRNDTFYRLLDPYRCMGA